MNRCKIDKCQEYAVFLSETCWHHIEDKDAYREKIAKMVTENRSFAGVNLSKVDLRGMSLSRADFSGANLSRVNLSESNLFDANLSNAELLGADLSNCDLTSANLENADLTRSSIRGARLWHANMKSANLIEADLNRCDVWNAKLFNARFWRTELMSAISLGKKNFQAKAGRFSTAYRINEKGIQSSEEAYRSLKSYFLASGRYDDASWASFKEKSMQRLLLKKRRNIAFIPSAIMNLLCGYGEKPHRIVLSSSFMILFYAMVYCFLDAIIYALEASYKMTVGDYIYYSVITFTTVGYGDFIPKSALLFRAVAATEAFVGTFMIGLFIFTLARKYSAR
ncbi:MAG: pentapeptide repeat-containing protein [Candidatus Omnitrophota bacterium]